MQPDKPAHHSIDSLFTLILFGLFTMTCILVTIFGAHIYQAIVSDNTVNTDTRTSMTYLAEKIRQNDAAGAISLGSVEDCPALVLSNTYGGTTYLTYIFCWEEELKEVTVRSTNVPSKESGQVITSVRNFQIEQISPQLYLCSATDSKGKEMSIYVNTNCQ